MSRTFLIKLLSLIACLSLLAFPLAGGGLAAAEVDLLVGLKLPLHVAPDGTLFANLSYSNKGGPASPEDTWVKLTLPAEVTFVSAVDKEGGPLPPDDVAGNELTWVIGALPADSVWGHIWVTVQLVEGLAEGTTLTFGGEVGSSAAETNVDNNIIEVSSEVCDMAGSTKQAQSGQVKPGDSVLYTITLQLAARKGVGETAQRMVTLIDELPPAHQVRFLGWENAPYGTLDGNQLHWQGQVRADQPVKLQYRLGIEGDVPPGTVITNRARVMWTGGELELEPVDVQVYLTDDDHMFGPGGGQWQHAYGVTIDVPPDALQEMTRFQLRAMFEENPPEDVPAGWKFANRAFEMKAFQFGEIHQFNQPLTITIDCPDEIPGLQQHTLRLWYRKGPGEPWAMLGEPVRHQNGQISFTTDHFTEFALFGQAGYRMLLPMIKN